MYWTPKHSDTESGIFSSIEAVLTLWCMPIVTHRGIRSFERGSLSTSHWSMCRLFVAVTDCAYFVIADWWNDTLRHCVFRHRLQVQSAMRHLNITATATTLPSRRQMKGSSKLCALSHTHLLSAIFLLEHSHPDPTWSLRPTCAKPHKVVMWPTSQ